MATLIQRVQAAVRAFVLGEGVVERSDMAWGHDSSQFSPPEYGDYLATSNGVYACATLRADLLASVPLKVYKGVGKKGKEVETGQLVDLLGKVNPFWTMDRLIRMTELSMCAWGSAFWFVERGKSGRGVPKELWWGKSDRVKVVPHPTKYVSGFIYDSLDGQQLYFEPNEVIWFRYPNPLDEFSGLSPLAAARLAADYATAAMKSNKSLFERGMTAAGFMMPKTGQPLLSEDQARELEEKIQKRFSGSEKAHRWGVLRFEAELKALNVTPREAEFTEGLRWSLEDIARAYKVPLDLIGGQRTYENVEAAQKAIWSHCIQPESMLIAGELTEQLLPMFPNEADEAKFDFSQVAVLQEAEGEKWTREKEQITTGVLTINEWRKEKNLTPLPWGDKVWWTSSTLVPVKDAEVEPPPPALEAPAPNVTVEKEQPKQLPKPKDEGRSITVQTRAIEYGSDAHTRHWRRFVRRTEKLEEKFDAKVKDLLRRQLDSALGKLRQKGRDANSAAESPFDLKAWVRTFRMEIRPLIQEVVSDAAAAALDDVGVGLDFDLLDPRVVRFIEGRAQRFAQFVNETTWDALRATIAEGLEAGESLDAIAKRIETIMEGRIRSSKETIARTEVNGAFNGGTLEGWRQSGLTLEKTWLAALDSRTRDTHETAHGQTVGIDDDFTVGGARGQHPGAMGKADEDINCRCSMVATEKE